MLKKKKEREKRDNDDEEPTTIKGPSTESMDVPDNAYDDGVTALLAKNKLIELPKCERDGQALPKGEKYNLQRVRQGKRANR